METIPYLPDVVHLPEIITPDKSTLAPPPNTHALLRLLTDARTQTPSRSWAPVLLRVIARRSTHA
jgi:hypothetical protein